MKMLVYCANGLQGQSAAQRLLKSGHQVRALVRDTNRAAPLAAAGAEIVFADLIPMIWRICSVRTRESTT